MKTARQLAEANSKGVVSCTPEFTVLEALQLMNQHKIGALLVMEDGKLAGVFSERDSAFRMSLHDKSPRTTKVREVMTSRVVCIGPEASVEDCMALMTDKGFRHLPVVEGDAVIGVLSIRDLVKETISHQRFIIEQLELYIRS